MHNVNIQVFTSAGTPGVQPIVFYMLTTRGGGQAGPLIRVCVQLLAIAR